MPSPPSLTRHLGQAERTLQALLLAQLAPSGLGFPEWTVLTFLSGATSLGPDRIVERLGSGRIAGPGEASAPIDAMGARGLIAPVEDGPAITAAGLEVYPPLQAAVAGLTATLVAGVPEADLEATRRTLETITHRAAQLLSDGASSDGNEAQDCLRLAANPRPEFRSRVGFDKARDFLTTRLLSERSAVPIIASGGDPTGRTAGASTPSRPGRSR